MKSSLKLPILIVVLFITTSLISWHSSPKTEKKEFTDDNKLNDLLAIEALYDKNPFSPDFKTRIPAAEDVLIQRILGDNQHLLIMAFYSKENYTGQFITLGNHSDLLFRDDGKGDDKKAGDGLFTAKVPADVSAFRKMAIDVYARIKSSGKRPVHFKDRVIVEPSPDEPENFDVNGFDSNDPVSIADLSFSAGASDVSAATTAPKNNTLSKLERNSVVITDLKVVEDPTRTWNPCGATGAQGNINGPWTFNTIMRQLASIRPNSIASDATVSDFVKSLLTNWLSDQIVNGDTAVARTKMNSTILDPWLTKSKNAGSPSGQLDMKFAPFKLLAMVNRFDLREGQINAIPGSPAGEGRFVFGLIKSNCTVAQQMTLILEYNINIPNTCSDIQAWALKWYNLKDLTVGSSEYNQALQDITDKFSLCGSNPNRVNQSSLDQLRTNEIILSDAPNKWELREFVLDGATHKLKENTVAQTPAIRYNAMVDNPDARLLVSYANSNAHDIKNETNQVPVTFSGNPFLGVKDQINGDPVGEPVAGLPPTPYHWDGTAGVRGDPTFIKADKTREKFSLNTCGGCHSGETQTSFTHIDPVFFGTEATLSGFLTGKAGQGGAIDFDKDPNNGFMSVKDPARRPASNPTIRPFNDFQRRAQGVKSVAETPCGSVLGISSELLFEQVNAPH